MSILTVLQWLAATQWSVALHESVGPKAIGEALNHLDDEDQHLLINRVRYYAMRDFEKALLGTKAGRANKKAVEAAFAN